MTSPHDLAVEHRYADLEGVRLHYVTAGEGPTILFLHGFPEFWYSWRHQIDHFSKQGYRVVAPDMRGYNLSSGPNGVASYSLKYLARDVSQLIDHLGEDKVYLVAHDWGAIVAWQFAMWYPDQLDKLAILNVPHPRTYATKGLASWKQKARSWYMVFFQIPFLPELLIQLTMYKSMAATLRRATARKDAFTREDVKHYVEAWSRPGRLMKMIHYYRAIFRDRMIFRRSEMAVVQCPVRVIWGLQDWFLIPEMSEVDPKWVPNCEVVKIEDAGHFVQCDRPEKVNRHLEEFFSSQEVR